jgi:hypothetical protein
MIEKDKRLDIAYKKIQFNKFSTSEEYVDTEERFISRTHTEANDVWLRSSSIPYYHPVEQAGEDPSITNLRNGVNNYIYTDSSGFQIIQKYVNVCYDFVPATENVWKPIAEVEANINRLIPHEYGMGFFPKVLAEVEPNEFIDLAIYSGDWVFDYPSGIIRFLGKLPPRVNTSTRLYITVYKYIGFNLDEIADLGVIGSTGATGVQGNIGVQGFVGNTGYQGLTGEASNTGATGSQGLKGDTGFQGIIGNQGLKGDTGYQGLVGNQGLKGDTGFTGWTGYTGWTGWTGSQGTKGDTGFQGERGLTGYQGLVGDTGWTGYQGLRGFQGPTGPMGEAGEVGSMGDTGFTGADGPQGLRGLTGYQGTTGSQGTKGDTGFQGDKGNTGYQGLVGDTGWTGSQGTKGDTGFQGERGLTGYQGLVGEVGSQGTKGDTGDFGPQGVFGDTGPIGPRGVQGPCCNEFDGTRPLARSGVSIDISPEAFGETVYGLQIDLGGMVTGGSQDGSAINIVGVSNTNVENPTFINIQKENSDILFRVNSEGTQTSGILLIDGFNVRDEINNISLTTGYTGWTGAQGVGGIDGATGINGSQGAQGLRGTDGIIGVDGVQGVMGDTGFQGLIGLTGYQGLIGNQGLVGDTGFTGWTGSQGRTGPQGIVGFQGTQGLSGTAVSTGAQGIIGNQGHDGVPLRRTTQSDLAIDGASGGGLDNVYNCSLSSNSSFSLSNISTSTQYLIRIAATATLDVTMPNTANDIMRKSGRTISMVNGDYVEIIMDYDGTTRFWQISEMLTVGGA